MSEVTEALDALVEGTRTLKDVEAMFLARTWPLPQAGQDIAALPEGSFTEVSDAYSNGVLTIDQYVVLAEAAAAAMNRQQQQSRPTTDEVNP